MSMLFYIVVGAMFWASFDDKDGTLLKQARNEHELLPILLMLTWPIFVLKLIYLKFLIQRKVR